MNEIVNSFPAELIARVRKLWPHHRRLHEELRAGTWLNGADGAHGSVLHGERHTYQVFHLGYDDACPPVTSGAEHGPEIWSAAELGGWLNRLPVEISRREGDHVVVRRRGSGLLIRVSADLVSEDRVPVSGWRPKLLMGWLYLVSGEADRAELRIYLNVSPDERLTVFRATALGLHAAGLSFQAKMAKDMETERPDAVVFYVSRGDLDAALRVMRTSAPPAVRRASVPGFSTWVEPGLALGSDGRALMGLSYGQYCARMVHRAVTAVRQREFAASSRALDQLDHVVPRVDHA